MVIVMVDILLKNEAQGRKLYMLRGLSNLQYNTQLEFTSLNNKKRAWTYISSSSSSSECSAQRQVPHSKQRNLGCSSAEGRLGNQGTVLLGI